MRLLALSLLIGACAARQEVRDKGFSDALSTQAALSRTLEPQRHALLIGVDHYRDPVFGDLRHAAHDAEALRDVLADPKGGGFDSVEVLSGEASRAEIFAALQAMSAQLRREDTAVFYFSGHGTRVPDSDAWRRFLLTSDSRAAHLEVSAIDLAELQAFFSELPATRKALIVDACFNGDGKSVVRPDALGTSLEDGDLLETRYALSPGEAHLFATTAGRPSRESDKLGHGVYTYYLLEAMSWGFDEADVDRDQVVTAWEAHDFARSRTLRFTENTQVPEAALRVTGEGDLILAGDRDQRRRREKALVYLYASNSHRYTNTDLVVDGRVRGALPGTVSVAPGRHRIELRDPDGNVLVDGYMSLAAERAYTVEDIQRVANGPARAMSIQPTTLASAPMRTSLGPGVIGLEISALQRVNTGPNRGFFTGWTLGGGGTPARTIDNTTAPRSVVWAGANFGYQSDLRRIRYRLGWGLSGIFLPSSWPDGRPSDAFQLADYPEQAGWLLFATGPSTAVGWVISESWTLIARPQAHFAVLDLDGGGARPIPWLSLGIGPEISW